MPWMWALALASSAAGLGLAPPPLGRFAERIRLGQFVAEGGEVNVWRATLDGAPVVLRFYKGLCVQPTHCTVSELVQRTWQEARANCGISVAASLRRMAVVRAAESAPSAREQPA